jgi:alpha-amylase
LLRNFKLSDDIAFRFSNQTWAEWPLTAQKYSDWIHDLDKKDELINLFMDYETFGEHQWEGSGIFEFLKEFPTEVISKKQFTFSTPSEVSAKYQPMAVLNVEHPISWADEERDLTAWLGNNLQREAFDNLYKLADDVALIDDKLIKQDWYNLQTSDHFYYMCTKYFSDGAVHQYFNPFESPYDAFINYMNILSDFTERVKKAPKRVPVDTVNSIVVEPKVAKPKKATVVKIIKTEVKKKK